MILSRLLSEQLQFLLRAERRATHALFITRDLAENQVVFEGRCGRQELGQFFTSFQKANSIIVVNIYDSLISASPSAFSFYVDLCVGVREGSEGQGLAI